MQMEWPCFYGRFRALMDAHSNTATVMAWANSIDPESGLGIGLAPAVVLDLPHLRGNKMLSNKTELLSRPLGYMEGAVPRSSDFDSPEFANFLQIIQHPMQHHRKLWEWAFILHHAGKEGKLQPGMRGLGFGVGLEKLPAIFAARGCEIVATDGTSEVASTWSKNSEYSNELSQLFFDFIIGKDDFERRVTFREADMNAIPQDLAGFDLCWSACALEQLGSLQAGFNFIENSLKTLKRGGVAIHTTELNTSSDTKTVSDGPTVLYRQADIAQFKKRMEDAGHKVRDIPILFGKTEIDQHVDVPPYTHNPHLRLQLMQYVTTSVGIVIEKG